MGQGQAAARGRQLLALDAEAPGLLAELAPLLNRHTINLIQEALAGQVLVVERNLDDLYDLLAGRVFLPAQLLEVVQQWLAGPAPEKPAATTHIRVLAAGRRETPAVADGNAAPYQAGPGALYSWLAAGYPELVPLWQQQGERELARTVATAWWLAVHHLDGGLLRQLCSLPLSEPAIPASLRELGRQVFELRAGPPEVMELIPACARQALADGGLLDEYWQALAAEPAPSGAALLAILQRETIFPALLHRAAREYLQWLARAGNQEKAAALALVSAGAHPTPGPSWEGPPPAAYLETCRVATQLFHSLAALTAANPAGYDAPAWEKIYITHLGGLESAYARLRQQLACFNLSDALPLNRLETDLQQVLDRFSQAFQEFYQQAGRAAGLTLAQLPARLDRYRQRWRPQALYFIWLDGLRLDAGETMVAELDQTGSIQQEIARGLHWAPLPAVTATQLASLQEAGVAFRFLDAGSPDHDLATLARAGNRLVPGQEDVALRLDLVDDRIHTATDDYAAFQEELALGFRRRLLPLLAALPEQSLILLTGDHGYTINHSFRTEDKHKQPRYLHGGCSPQEVLVPWLLLWKTGNRPQGRL